MVWTLTDDEPADQRADAASGAGHALVLGGLDIAGPLCEQGVPVTILRPRAEPSRFSRRRIGWVEQPTPAPTPSALLSAAQELPGPVVLYAADDEMLRHVSDHRDMLRPELSFLMPDREVVEALLDKGRFQRLAVRHGLPIPDGEVVSTVADLPAANELPLPVVIKPLVWHAERLQSDFGDGKAMIATTSAELRAVLDRVAHTYERVLVQRFIAGSETAVESYHVYVDTNDRIAAEFTGRKIRTSPAEFGQSTALTTTCAQDVVDLGRRVVRAVGVRGVAKVDFKRDEAGKLWLFEVNARFSLWHRLGAAAGCNIPALVFADLTDRPRPAFTQGRPGLTWCRQPRDMVAAREQGVALGDYLRWLRRCDAVSGLRVSDPMPFLRGSLPIQVRTAIERARSRRRQSA